MYRRSIALALTTLLAGSFAPQSAHATEKPAVAATGASAPRAAQPKPAAAKPAPVKRVDINSASKAELMTLPGVGPDEAERIIKARPYPSKAKLAVDKVIPDALYHTLQSRIVAAQPAKAKPAARAASKP